MTAVTALAAPLSTAPTPSTADELNGISEWVVGVMEVVGAPGAGLIVALENLFPPLPSEVILPLAGFTASRGSFSLLDAIMWTTAGSVLGAYILYALGGWLGRERTRALVRRIPLVNVDDVDKVEAWFARHGSKAVFFGRLVPLFRSLVSIPAGIEKMPVWRFLGLTFAGSFIWNSVLIMAGFFLGENWHVVEQYAGIFQKVVIAAVVILVVAFVLRKVRERRSKVDA
ncbi:DedA family protein [Pseudarthrobacter sulfonivorans]|uniref:DedA family protein n=1 Tax=Pseudarthrobacter sulfonivorans TaxID=121292 RepID=UPI00278B1097|nr:DedA family protein [Pseudarthrobacter sulfonivorans]MDP9999652.1 membrane protein DedA with SNARE-associated domain [Pseudarthrobacter sulfonivorans]